MTKQYEPERYPRPLYVILGATGGIGTALTWRLAASGAHLTLAARGEERLARLANDAQADWTAVDATKFDDVEACVQSVVDKYGRVDGVVNLVGSILLKPAHLTKPAELEETLQLNLWSAFAAVRAAAKAMQKSGGSVVLMSTAAASTGLVNHEAVAAAKAGVEGLTRSAAATYARSNIRVNAVAPGLVNTPLAERITKNPASLEASKAMHPLGRIGEPEDVASAIAWLVASEQSWLTGQVIGVDGGLARLRGR
jgi:NAD(P)-dependent dehydrogenase (short-subunit alcohol dehydrogenase family)